MLTPERYDVLRAISVGDAYHLWPMMRRAFLRERLIEPAGDPPEPSDKRRAKQPQRPYRVTRRGRTELVKFESSAVRIEPVRPRAIPIKTQINHQRRGVSSGL